MNWPKRNPSQDRPSGLPGERDDSAGSTSGTVRGQSLHSWVDDLVARHEQEGGFADLPGKGKPLDLGRDGSYDATFQRVLKNADVLPKWIELQREIAADLNRLVQILEQDSGATVDLAPVNAKVRKYNEACPSPLLQKGLITRDNMMVQGERWQ